MLEIKVTIWSTKSIGIAVEKRFQDIQITYKDKEGNRLYPDTYEAVGDKLLDYPRDGKKSFIRVIPIADLKRKYDKERDTNTGEQVKTDS